MTTAPADTHHVTIRAGQHWYLPSPARRRPARTVVEVVPTLGYVDYADPRGERRWCSLTSFASWARTYGAYVR